MHIKSGERHIIPLRRGPVQDFPDIQTEGGHSPASSRDAVRHYLKFMLPAIPVVTFVMSFLYSYLLVGFNSDPVTPADLSLLPLIGALLMSLTTGMLCLVIFTGVVFRLDAAAARTPPSASPADAEWDSDADADSDKGRA
jgi:hypothetical protein